MFWILLCPSWQGYSSYVTLQTKYYNASTLIPNIPNWVFLLHHAFKGNMDPATLTAFLAPFLPALLNLGSKAATSAATKAGETAGIQLTDTALNKAKAVWEKLRPKVEAKESAKEAVKDVAKAPEDADSQAALRIQLKKILDADPALATAIAQILEYADSIAGTRVVQTVSGNQNQVIGQVSGGQVFGNIIGNVPLDAIAHQRPDLGTLASSTAQIMPTACKTILFLAAHPRGTSPLQLAQEVREIQIGLERARQRDRFSIEQRWAVTAEEVRRALLNCAPHIIHFSGHGVASFDLSQATQQQRKLSPVAEAATAIGGLVFEDANGQPQLVSGEALAQLFGLFANQIECVVLNACYSTTQAKAIARHIPYVVGMKQEIGDRAAIEFAIGFYDAILAGKSIEFAYRLGCSAIQMAGIPEHLTPVLEKSD
jgi:hypothetical protein